MRRTGASRTGKPLERVYFSHGPTDARRWRNLKNFDPSSMFTVLSEQIFPWLRSLGDRSSTYATHMKVDHGAAMPAEPPALAGIR